MKKLMILSGALAAFAVCADNVPVVSDITMTQATGSRLVTIDYTLKEAAAVITLDIQTNVTDGVWASIGGENIQNVSGDVWKKVEIGPHTISWRPDLSWPDHEIANGGARAVVTAWSVDNPPDYLVVDLSLTGGAGTERYYPAVEFLPGGLLANDDYRNGKLVMRKIPAKGVEWQMGCVSETGNGSDEGLHDVTLTSNYYIGVFEITQAQWALVQTSRRTPAAFTAGPLTRPVESVSYNEIRNAANSTTANTTFDYPADPNPGSFLGLLRTKTGLLFDLPSEAQWEFACRAGHGTGYWGDGSLIGNSDDYCATLVRLARTAFNGGTKTATIGEDGTVTLTAVDLQATTKNNVTTYAVGPENGTAIVGSYAPNSWGLYDMHGNVWEWCLDWYAADISALKGTVNTAGSKRVCRGGGWRYGSLTCRSARRRSDFDGTKREADVGFRVALPIGTDE